MTLARPFKGNIYIYIYIYHSPLLKVKIKIFHITQLWRHVCIIWRPESSDSDTKGLDPPNLSPTCLEICDFRPSPLPWGILFLRHLISGKSQPPIFAWHRSRRLVRQLGLAGTWKDASWRGSMSHSNFRISYDGRAELWQFPFSNLVFGAILQFQDFCFWNKNITFYFLQNQDSGFAKSRFSFCKIKILILQDQDTSF